jgi:hypothetical protein
VQHLRALSRTLPHERHIVIRGVEEDGDARQSGDSAMTRVRRGCVVASPGLPGCYPLGEAVEFSWSPRAPVDRVVASPGPPLPRRRVGALTYSSKRASNMAFKWTKASRAKLSRSQKARWKERKRQQRRKRSKR